MIRPGEEMRVYGQPQGPVVAPDPSAPFAPKPGPTRPGVAVASAVVFALVLAANLVVRLIWREVGGGYSAAYSLSVVSVQLIIVIYLFVVGRGPRGKALGGGASLVAYLISVATVVAALSSATTSSAVFNILDAASGMLTVLGWGLARRSGSLWALSVPLSLGAWALWTFVLWEKVSPSGPYHDAVEQWYSVMVPWMTLSVGVPIVIGWGLELMARGGDTSSAPARSSVAYATPAYRGGSPSVGIPAATPPSQPPVYLPPSRPRSFAPPAPTPAPRRGPAMPLRPSGPGGRPAQQRGGAQPGVPVPPRPSGPMRQPGARPTIGQQPRPQQPLQRRPVPPPGRPPSDPPTTRM